MAVKKIIRKFTEELERLGKTAAEQVTGTGEYDTKSAENKILPPEEKQKIKSQEMAMLRDINAKIEEIRKQRQKPEPQQEEQKKIVKKQEEKKKEYTKSKVLMDMLKAREGSGESKKYGSG